MHGSIKFNFLGVQDHMHPLTSKRQVQIPCVSSLPPSSPPSLSSQFPHSDFNDQEFPPEDPFGFLAVEHKLKVTRATHAPSHHTGSYLHNSFRTSRKLKRRLVHSPGTSIHGTDSMPSTPSPSKPVPGTVLCATSAGVVLSHTCTDDPLSSPRGNAGTETGKQLITRKKKRNKKGKPLPEKSVDPEELDRNLVSLLPKKPVKTQAPAKVKEKEKQGTKIVNETRKALVEKCGEVREGKGKGRKGKNVKENV